MKIALDLDDTINGAPDFWSFITKLLIDNGHEVHVITDRDPFWHQKQTEEELEWLEISYTKLKITGDKAKYCQEHGIDFAVDDYCDVYYQQHERTKAISPFIRIAHFKK